MTPGRDRCEVARSSKFVNQCRGCHAADHHNRVATALDSRLLRLRKESLGIGKRWASTHPYPRHRARASAARTNLSASRHSKNNEPMTRDDAPRVVIGPFQHERVAPAA